MPPAATPDPAALRRLTQFLAANGSKLGKRARAVVDEYGDDAVPLLIALACDRDLGDEEALGGGYVPIHAVTLLGERGDARAVEPLLELVEQLDLDSIIYGTCIDALGKFGEALVEPALALHARTKRADARTAVAEALSDCGVKDERIFSILCDRLTRDPEVAVTALTAYGDPAALPSIYEALRVYLSKPREVPMGIGGINAFRRALEVLGGTMPPDLEAAAAAQRALQERARTKFLSETGFSNIQQLPGFKAPRPR
ncbi:MAG: hypothetical protein R3F39_07395 [Myxococcota bacterium]